MKKEKRTKIILRSILILFLSVFVTSSAFAYGDGPDKSVSAMSSFGQPSGSPVDTNSSFTNAWTTEELNLVLNAADVAESENTIRHAEAELGSWEVVTRAGDVASAGAQYGPMVYVFLATGEVVIAPIALVWQLAKHGSRLLYGAYTGNWETIRSVNDRSLTGRIVNRITRLDGSTVPKDFVYDAQHPMRGNGIK